MRFWNAHMSYFWCVKRVCIMTSFFVNGKQDMGHLEIVIKLCQSQTQRRLLYIHVYMEIPGAEYSGMGGDEIDKYNNRFKSGSHTSDNLSILVLLIDNSPWVWIYMYALSIFLRHFIRFVAESFFYKSVKTHGKEMLYTRFSACMTKPTFECSVMETESNDSKQHWC